MAILADINSTLVTLVSNALTAAGIPNVEIGTEYPPDDALQDAGKDMTPIVAIIHKMTSYQSRNMRFQHSITKNPVSITSTLSDFSIAPSQSVTLTLGFAEGFAAISTGDGASCILSNGDFNNAATDIASDGATLDSMAIALAAAINTKFSTFTAVASGAVITITNNDTVGYHILSNVGNGVTVAETVKWASRSMQINVWCGDLNTKFAIQEALETLLAQIDDAEGFFLPSGEWVQLKFHGAKPDNADVDKDVYTDFYLFTIDNMVDILKEMRTIVAPIGELSVQ